MYLFPYLAKHGMLYDRAFFVARDDNSRALLKPARVRWVASRDDREVRLAKLKSGKERMSGIIEPIEQGQIA